MSANRWREYIEAYQGRCEEIRSMLKGIDPDDPSRGEMEAALQQIEDKVRGWEHSERQQKDEQALRAERVWECAERIRQCAERIRALRAELEALEALPGCEKSQSPSLEDDDGC